MITEEELEYQQQLEAQLREQANLNRQLHGSQMSMFGGVTDENLIKWQLNLREDLDWIYHLLRGDVVKEDENGNVRFIEQTDDNLRPFNEFGIQLIMNIISFYINRNTILSNYSDEVIEWKVHDFALELTDLIFNRYEEMMMTTTFEKEFEKAFGGKLVRALNGRICIELNNRIYFASDYMIDLIYRKIYEHLLGKMKMYQMIVRAVVDSVHSSYLRAYREGERKSLREARTVTQHDSIGKPMMSYSQPLPQPKKSILKPWKYFKT